LTVAGKAGSTALATATVRAAESLQAGMLVDGEPQHR
jgi:hypothetical protein